VTPSDSSGRPRLLAATPSANRVIEWLWTLITLAGILSLLVVLFTAELLLRLVSRSRAGATRCTVPALTPSIAARLGPRGYRRIRTTIATETYFEPQFVSGSRSMIAAFDRERSDPSALSPASPSSVRRARTAYGAGYLRDGPRRTADASSVPVGASAASWTVSSRSPDSSTIVTTSSVGASDRFPPTTVETEGGSGSRTAGLRRPHRLPQRGHRPLQ